MARYIDKDQVIEWIKQRLLPTVTNGNYDDWEKGADNERINFLSFINSLPEETNIKLLHDSSEISMTDKVQLIKQEIEKRINNLWYLIPEGEKVLKDDFTKDDANNLWKYTALESLLQFIDSLPEESASEDLEEYAKKLAKGAALDKHNLIWMCKKGAEWQKQQMKEALQTEYEKGRFDMREEMVKDAVEGEVVYQIGSSVLAPTDIRYKVVSDKVYIPNVKLGDRVKIIIVKTEQQ